MLGRTPLMPCFVDGHVTQTIPHKYSRNKNSCFPASCADSSEESSGRLGSTVYEVNQWLWQFGHGKPRLGYLTIKETSDYLIRRMLPARCQTRVGRRLMRVAVMVPDRK
jgi:hypothetical protein